MANAVGAAISSSLIRLTSVRRVAVVSGLLAVAACGEAPSAPRQSIDRAAAARVIPSVLDARLRLAVGIENVAVRDRVTHDLRELESALASGDGEKARFHARVLATVVTDYRTQQASMTTDGADVTAITLMLRAVSQVIDAGFEFSLSP
jgi:hypothetical protein